eukprot:11610573-Ditylum_brightwellii.AAC.1
MQNGMLPWDRLLYPTVPKNLAVSREALRGSVEVPPCTVLRLRKILPTTKSCRFRNTVLAQIRQDDRGVVGIDRA